VFLQLFSSAHDWNDNESETVPTQKNILI
jgi:hypothetical protein